jgi:hypothetical protein
MALARATSQPMRVCRSLYRLRKEKCGPKFQTKITQNGYAVERRLMQSPLLKTQNVMYRSLAQSIRKMEVTARHSQEF